MSGDLCKKEIFTLAEVHKAMMIVDEAHSAGVLGFGLLGIFEYYAIKVNERHIKMGTLGKAYGSYGAYILASKVIVSYLVNRAKPIIYSTAPSVFDIALAYVNMNHIRKNAREYHKKILARQMLVRREFDLPCPSLIVPIEMSSNEQTEFMKEGLMEQGYLVGGIRQPTVDKPMMRVILNVEIPLNKIRHVLALIRHNSL
jgi:8-amino-7-oxononanoate synthase